MLARGLYDLPTTANRVLVWVTVSVALATVYGLVIGGVGALLHTVDATWLPWAAAAVTAVSFDPIRSAEQPRDVLAGFGARLEAAADVARLLDDLSAELAAMGLKDLVILSPDHQVLSGLRSSEAGLQVLPRVAYGRVSGVLKFREPVGGLRRRDRDLLELLAAHLGGSAWPTAPEPPSPRAVTQAPDTPDPGRNLSTVAVGGCSGVAPSAV